MAQLMVRGLPEYHILRMSLLSVLLGPGTVQTAHLNQGAGPNGSIALHVQLFSLQKALDKPVAAAPFN